MATHATAAVSDMRDAAAAGLPPVGALHAATTADAPPPPPPPAPHPGGLGELDLEGLLTHPHLGVLVLQYLCNDTRAATALRGTCRGARDAAAAHRWHDTATRVVWARRWRTLRETHNQASIMDGVFMHLVYQKTTSACHAPVARLGEAGGSGERVCFPRAPRDLFKMRRSRRALPRHARSLPTRAHTAKHSISAQVQVLAPVKVAAPRPKPF